MSVLINGVVYFQDVDAQNAVIKVQNYIYAVFQFAQEALIDVVGWMIVDDSLVKLQKIGDIIEVIIER